MGGTPALLYTLGLLPFGLDLTRFSPCTKCYKSHCWDLRTTILCILHPPTGQMLHQFIYSQVSEVAVSDTKSPRVKKTLQTTFVIKTRVMDFILEACLISPCLVPLVLWPIRTIMEVTIKRKMATHAMRL
jgi:hypothetical protein